MNKVEGCPRLKAGCRMSPAKDVLLIPEGALRLEGPGLAIVDACDGKRTVQQVVDHLVSLFRNADPARVYQETTTFLNKLAEKGAVEFV